MCTACHPAEEADGGTACPPAPTCVQNTLVTCGDGGVVEQPCGEARCAFDAPVPRCVPATALPCDPGAAPLRCENGRLVDCDPEAGYFLPRACDRGQFCAGDDPPRCLEAEQVRCRPDFWAPLCVAGERFECAARGVLEAVPDTCL